MRSASPGPDESRSGAAVRGMFASIAPRYDRLNRLLSFGRDRRWRRALVARLGAVSGGERVLDVCTGTGDVARALARALGPTRPVHGADFCEEMVGLAPGKLSADLPRPRFLVADAQALPYGAGQFRAVTVAFGLRNVEDPPAALAEMARVLLPGGRLLILEFHRPQNCLFAAVYKLYFFGVLPWVGRVLSRSPVDAYRYLPASVWTWPSPEDLGATMGRAGLRVIEQRRFLLGAVVLHVAERPGP